MKIIQQNTGTKIITDRVTLGSCYLNPTFEFDAIHGSVNLNIRIKAEDYKGSELETVIDTALVVALEKAQKDNPKVKTQIKLLPKAIPELDSEGSETGYLLFKCKNKARFEHNGELKDRKITVVDSKNNPVEEYKLLTTGTEARVSFTMVPWYMASRKETSISFWLQGLQVLSPKFFEGTSDFDEDDSEDNWEAPATVAECNKTIEDFQGSATKGSSDPLLNELTELTQ